MLGSAVDASLAYSVWNAEMDSWPDSDKDSRRIRGERSVYENLAG